MRCVTGSGCRVVGEISSELAADSEDRLHHLAPNCSPEHLALRSQARWSNQNEQTLRDLLWLWTISPIERAWNLKLLRGKEEDREQSIRDTELLYDVPNCTLLRRDDLPCHAINSRRSLTLEGVAQKIDAEMVSRAVSRSCFLSLAALRTPSSPWDMPSPLCVRSMVAVRCSPSSAPFPPRPPPKVAALVRRFTGIRRSPTSPARACPSCGYGPSRTGLRKLPKAQWRSPGSRPCCFLSVRGR